MRCGGLARNSCYNLTCSADHEKAAAVSRHDACIRPAAPDDAADLVALARRVLVPAYAAGILAPTLRFYFHECMTPTPSRAQFAPCRCSWPMPAWPAICLDLQAELHLRSDR